MLQTSSTIYPRLPAVSVEQLGGIGFRGQASQAPIWTGAATSFGKLNLKIAEAARGEKEASEAFKALGISVKDAAGKYEDGRCHL